MSRWTAFRAVVFLALLTCYGQLSLRALQTMPKPAFEVVSVKKSNGQVRGSISNYRPGGVYVATNVSLKFMIREAYGVRDFEVVGGPGWMDDLTFDVQGRPPAGGNAATNGAFDRRQLMLMLQSMLEDRFQLKTHMETRQLAVYEMVTVKNGARLQRAAEIGGPCGSRGQAACPGVSMSCCKEGIAEMKGTKLSPKDIADTFAGRVQRPVIDKTGLEGEFDFELSWLNDDRAAVTGDASGPSIFTALQEQLGVKLESARAPVTVVVIDGAQPPSDN